MIPAPLLPLFFERTTSNNDNRYNHSPLKAIWEPNIPHSCFQVGYFLLIAGLINTATDFACTLLPILIVSQLHMSVRQRFAVSSVFLVGFVANVASCLRIYYAFRETESGDIWNQMQPSIASNSELGLGLVRNNVHTH